MCVARCLLSGAPLVLLDEATAAVDPRTAALIHQVRFLCLLGVEGGVCVAGFDIVQVVFNSASCVTAVRHVRKPSVRFNEV